jgi:hypothetical protein
MCSQIIHTIIFVRVPAGERQHSQLGPWRRVHKGTIFRDGRETPEDKVVFQNE